MLEEPRFDIFSGAPDKDAMWLEVVTGLAGARERMEEIAREIPGRYFVFSIHSRVLLATVDTTKNFIKADRCSQVVKDVA
ncbi:MAG TPA: hypothetical protein VG322_06935 [Candidatus Acidoferrales bacterium]|jgi:hypothetical protein|nr:hypothetical protein [Candidatus Acidoferrales bacterium]